MKVLIVIAALTLAGYAGCQAAFPSVTIRYRLTLTVEADGQAHTGSGVIQVTYAKEPQILGSSSAGSVTVKGEAVSVDLGSRGMLFALLKQGDWSRSDPANVVPNVFGVVRGGFSSDPEIFKRLAAVRGSRELTPGQLPMLVRFRDIADPASVESVDPDHLDARFGPGVRLSRATIEITRDAVTSKIGVVLGWLRYYYSKRLDGDRYGNIEAASRTANSLNAGDFRTGGW